MAMNDNINIEIERGNVNAEFLPHDLYFNQADTAGEAFWIGERVYRKVSIPTHLNNMSIGPGKREGYTVKKGVPPHFIKLASGRFKLIKTALHK